MRAYSSGVTFVPMDLVRRDAMRGLLAEWRALRTAHRSNVVTRGSCVGTESAECRESRTIRAVPIGEPPVPCSTRNGVTCHLLLPVRSTAHVVRHYRAASASSSSLDADRPASCCESDDASR